MRHEPIVLVSTSRHNLWDCVVKPPTTSETGKLRSMPSAPLVLLYTSALIIGTAGSVTFPADVLALQQLGQLLRQGDTPPPQGWLSSSQDPCGRYGTNCGNISPVIPAQNQLSPFTNSCAWEGIACRDWRIVAVVLPCSQQLGCIDPYVGQLPQSLGNLTALQYLSLSGHQLSGSLPAASNWPSLTVLDLHGNSITGTLPTQWGVELKQVVQIDLGGNQLDGKLPGEWGQLKQLQHLDLSVNNLQGSIPSSWAGMTSLKELLLDHNCGLCGDVPFPMTSSNQATSNTPDMSHMLVTTYDTLLGDMCGPVASDCSTYDARTPLIAVSVLLTSLALCLLQRSLCWVRAPETAATDAPPTSSETPHHEQSEGVVKVVHPNRHIPMYECRVNVSLHKPSIAGTDDDVSSTAQPDSCSNAAKGGAQTAATAVALTPAEASTTSSWYYLGPTPAALQPVSTEMNTHASHHSTCFSCYKSDASSSSKESVHPALDMSRHLVPTVIVMPDRQHLALAVPDDPPSRHCGSAYCSSRDSSGRSSAIREGPLGSDIESGTTGTAAPNSGQQAGQDRRGAYDQAVRAGQQLRRGMLWLFVSRAA